MATFQQFTKEPMKYVDDISIDTLEKYLRKLSALYYNTGTSTVSDQMFDILKDKLEEKDPNNPFLDEIGAPLFRDKVKLPFPMGSLNKFKPTEGDFDKWINTYKGPYELSDKMDGISALLFNDNGTIYLYSRGDGIFGQNISHLIPYINVGIDQLPNNTAVRGELIMTKKHFAKFSDKMANARNAVAGIVNAKKFDKSIAKYVDFIAYNVVSPRMLQSKQYNKLLEWNFDVVKHKESSSITIDKLIKYFQKRRDECDYDIDGIVVMDNNMVYDVVEGNPKYGFAFKSIMKDQHTVANVVDVEWEISKHNYIKPRIKIEPVKLVGVTITYATAHNAKFIYDNKIGVGSKVKIIRSGDVIPKIMEVVKASDNGKPKMPDISYKWNDTNVDIMVDKENETDESKEMLKIKQLTNMMEILHVKYINIGIITKLVNSGFDSLRKILNAEEDDIYEIIGEKMTDKIYTNLENSLEHTQLHILMAASNCFGRGLGIKKLRVITKEYPDIMVTKYSDKVLYDNINSLSGFQDKTSQKFVEGFAIFKKFFNKINKIVDIEYLREPDDESKSTLLSGKTFVITGFRDADIVKYIEDNGGTVSGSVSKKTTLVIYAPQTTSEKMTKAEQIGVPMVTKQKFIDDVINKKH